MSRRRLSRFPKKKLSPPGTIKKKNSFIRTSIIIIIIIAAFKRLFLYEMKSVKQTIESIIVVP